MHGVIVFAHGSRDPQWRAPVEAVAQRIRALQPGWRVDCAYLELCTPDLGTAVAAQVAAGVTDLRALPMFLGVGKHLREDLPRLTERLRQAHPQLRLQVLPPIAEDPRLLELLAQIAVS